MLRILPSLQVFVEKTLRVLFCAKINPSWPYLLKRRSRSPALLLSKLSTSLPIPHWFMQTFSLWYLLLQFLTLQAYWCQEATMQLASVDFVPTHQFCNYQGLSWSNQLLLCHFGRILFCLWALSHLDLD